MSQISVQRLEDSPFGVITYFFAPDVVAICGANPPWNIVSVNIPGKTFTVQGNHASLLASGDFLTLAYNTGTGGQYFSVAPLGATNVGPNTVINVNETIPPSTTATGVLYLVAITLTATVIGDLTGHTVEWDQISGPAITWKTPQNQLSVIFTYNIIQDRLFRFYIDRYTIFEQSIDVWVYGTPTSITQLSTVSQYANFIGTSSSHNFNLVTGDQNFYQSTAYYAGSDLIKSGRQWCRAAQLEMFPVSAAPAYPVGDGDYFSGSGPIGFYSLVAIPPVCDQEQIIGYQIQQQSAAGWTNYGPFVSSLPVVIVPSGFSYRVLVVFSTALANLFNSSPQAQFDIVASDPFFAQTNPTQADERGRAVSDLYQLGTTKNYYLQNYVFLDITKKSITEADFPELGQDEYQPSPGPAVNRIQLANYIFLDLQKRNVTEADFPELGQDEYQPSPGPAVSRVTLTNYTVLGGATIGG